MLADLIVSRSALGADRGRDDLHRHATFSCAIHSMVRRVLQRFRAA